MHPVNQTSYADMVKGRDSDDLCEAGPSHAKPVNQRGQGDQSQPMQIF